MLSAQIADNVRSVRERIAKAADRAGRMPSEVMLIAVTKTRTPQEVISVCQAGVRDIGENRVGEAEDKQPKVDLSGISWHMVGHLQSRKSKRAIEVFDILHSLDSVKLARGLDRLADEREMVLPVLIEVNVSGEASKYGFSLSDRGALDPAVDQILSLSHLRVEGLMTVAFVAEDPEEVRPVFAKLRALRDTFRLQFPQSEWKHLSMGMTDDFEIAIEEGATMVRIGRALFGPRS
jgi:pyridoxal phosphate enzyme (YggS family)